MHELLPTQLKAASKIAITLRQARSRRQQLYAAITITLQDTHNDIGEVEGRTTSRKGLSKMRLFHLPTTLAPSLLLLLLLLLLSPSILAAPLNQTTELVDFSDIQNTTLAKRCDNPCGWAGQLCCAWGQTCYTDAASQAQCGGYAATTTTAAAVAAGGYWQYYTSTWVETDLITKTQVYSSYVGAVATVIVTSAYVPAVATATYVPAATATGAILSCNWPIGETACGNICCGSTQYCLVAGQCAISGHTTTVAVVPVAPSIIVVKTTLLSAFSAPLRPTASSLLVVTTTRGVVVLSAAASTVPFVAPVATGANITLTSTQADAAGDGLSGGAIAGIVIGVLAGIVLLLLLCLFFCFRELWHALTGFFGSRDDDRRRETVEYKEYHRHGAAGSGGGPVGPDRRRWPGDRPRRPPPRRSGGADDNKWKEWGGVAAILGAIAVALGFQRSNNNNNRRDEKSDYTSSSYDSYFSDGTSESDGASSL